MFSNIFNNRSAFASCIWSSHMTPAKLAKFNLFKHAQTISYYSSSKTRSENCETLLLILGLLNITILLFDAIFQLYLVKAIWSKYCSIIWRFTTVLSSNYHRLQEKEDDTFIKSSGIYLFPSGGVENRCIGFRYGNLLTSQLNS